MLILALFACSGSVTLEPAQDGCSDFDYNDPAESKLVAELGDGSAVVRRTNVLLETTGLAFDPEIVPDDRVINVYEAWVVLEETGEGPFCYAPEVQLREGSGAFQVRWFLEEGDSTPFDTVEVEL